MSIKQLKLLPIAILMSAPFAAYSMPEKTLDFPYFQFQQSHPITVPFTKVVSEAQLKKILDNEATVVEQQKVEEDTGDHDETSYCLSFDDASPVKDISLKNTEVNAIVYSNGYPRGRVTVKTDEDQSFVLKHNFPDPLVLEVFSIAGENKQKALCEGDSVPGKMDIKIKCVIKNKSDL